ncbi:MAG: phosphohistidine phosphatase SixA [Bacteroidota bacterium]
MNLYLVRHGEAAPLGGTVQRDADRPLTQRGEKDVATIAGALAAVDGEPALILTSPLARAMQTARIIATVMKVPPEIRATENLSPGFRPKALLAELTGLGAVKGVIAVGHQPDLGGLIAYLVAEGSYVGLSIPPGAAACVVLGDSLAPGDTVLRWLLTADMVRRITTTT